MPLMNLLIEFQCTGKTLDDKGNAIPCPVGGGAKVTNISNGVFPMPDPRCVHHPKLRMRATFTQEEPSLITMPTMKTPSNIKLN